MENNNVITKLDKPLAALNIANVTENVPNRCVINKENIYDGPSTPVSNFKRRELRTPNSNRSPLKRTSLSPNPKCFLHKAEDPIAQRILSPLVKSPRVENMPKTAVYFHQLVEKEERKFKASLAIWEKVLEEDTTPEAVHGQILSAIGQANLFQNKRFKQFKELIELHKDKTAEKAAHASDLDGFWEMIFYQVEDVHKRFAELHILRANNWEEKKTEQPVPKPKHTKKSAVVVSKHINVKAKTKKIAVPSKFKMFRQQMMANKQEEEQKAK